MENYDIKEFVNKVKDIFESGEWSEIDELIWELTDFSKQYYEDVEVEEEYGNVVIKIGDIDKVVRIPVANIIVVITDDIEIE